MKLNCDLGESFGEWQLNNDDAVMPHIDQANLACGYHAGDPVTLVNSLAAAKKFKVEVGAHPAYPDLAGFGRRSMAVSEAELKALLHYQIGALAGLASVQGVTLSYVKPHGALYNDMMANESILQTVMQAVAEWPTPLVLMLQATPQAEHHRQQAKSLGLTLLFEAFADRRYHDNGKLQSRRESGSVLKAEESLAQVQQLLTDQSVTTVEGNTLPLRADTLCVHGDNADGVNQIEAIRELINKHAR